MRIRYIGLRCGNNSVGRVSASQAESRGFKSRFPLLGSTAQPAAFFYLYTFYLLIFYLFGPLSAPSEVTPSER